MTDLDENARTVVRNLCGSIADLGDDAAGYAADYLAGVLGRPLPPRTRDEVERLASTTARLVVAPVADVWTVEVVAVDAADRRTSYRLFDVDVRLLGEEPSRDLARSFAEKVGALLDVDVVEIDR